MYIRILLLFWGALHIAWAQDVKRYWVEFVDKNTSFDPYEYFDAKAIERRVIHQINLFDSTDFPVNEQYLTALSEYSEVIYASRWLNAAYVAATEVNIQEILQLPFVRTIIKSECHLIVAEYHSSDKKQKDQGILEKLAARQIELMKGSVFKENGITGRGVRIAVFDGGFPNVDTHPAFKHIREEGRIIATFDFTKNRENPYRGSSHGLSTFSNIGGKFGDMLIGLAPDAEYLLAITEVNREILKEEVWWIAAAEWADKHGAQIINSSLGYTEPRYSPRQMDGRHTMVSRAANMAVAKGILVVNAAGNEGTSAGWQIIGAPADADSVLSVGGVSPVTGLKISFSSFGPTAHRKMKPNVSASGTTVAAGRLMKYSKVDGTSFASPLVAGFAACVMQLNPGLQVMEYFDLIQRSAHLYPYYDYAHGYGVSQADYFFEKKNQSETFKAQGSIGSFNSAIVTPLEQMEKSERNLSNTIKISIIDDLSISSAFPAFDYFYYHFSNDRGELLHYEVVIPARDFTISIPNREAQFFRAFYKGYYVELQIR